MGFASAVTRLAITLMIVLGPGMAAAAEVLSGFYYGVKDATGASIEIRPDAEGFLGTFFDAQGNSQAFEADRAGEIAEAVLDMDGRTVLMRMAPLPYGAEVTIIPFDAAGNLVISAVQLDLIWKLCLAPAADRALAIALRGQGVACGEVIEGIAEAQRSGAFVNYKAEVAGQKATLRMTVRCADFYPESKQNCDRAALELGAQAISLETAGTVLARYR